MKLPSSDVTFRDTMERFEATLRRAPVVLFTQDEALRYTWVHNPAFADADHFLGKTDVEVFPASSAELLIGIKSEVLQRGQGIRTEVLVELPGGPAHYDLTLEPLRDADGRITGVAGAALDITERKRAVQQLFEVNQRLNALMQAVPVGVTFSSDISCQQITGNPAALAQFSADPDDNLSASSPDDSVRGRRLRFFQDGREIANTQLPLQRAVAENREIAPYEFEVVMPDGGRWTCEGSGAPVRDEQGNVIAGIAVTVDITERKRTEQALKEADQRKDEFLATLAHELRNPLAPIRNAARLLITRGDAHPEVRWASDVIERQVQVMAHLLEDLMDVSRISQGRLELCWQTIDLTSVLAGAVETSRPLIDAAKHGLDIDLPPEPVVLHGDPVRLAQVFSNLLNNSARYTPSGGRIRLSARSDGEVVVVRVSDNGSGIAAEHQARLFELFSQAALPDDRQSGGLGIGLWLVRRLVELHAGEVTVRSDGPGHGSEFIVRLPLRHREGQGPAAPTDAPDASSPRRQRVLVVDDLKDSADSLAMIVRAMGHEAHATYGGAEAVEVCDRILPDVLLLDIGMPGIDGLEVCRRIRQKPWGRRARVIAVTGWGQAEDRQKTADAGFDHHLVKPVDPAALAALLQERRPER